MADFDVFMIGPFPADAQRIEGGVQASLFGLCRTLQARGGLRSLRVVATPKHVGGATREGNLEGIPVTYLSAPWRFLMSSVFNVPALLRLLATSPRPLVHLHGSGLFELAVLAACRLRGIPIVWTLHGITEKETLEAFNRTRGIGDALRFALYRTCERLQLRLASEMIVDTPYVTREIGGRIKRTPKVVHQGIFLDELAVARRDHRPDPLVVSVGVIHPRKGHDLTLRAFASVLERVPTARLRIIGSLAEPDHLAALHQIAGELGITHAVSIEPDQPRSAILEAFAAARLFALHSEEESQGIALCEALAVGLPLVVTTAGGIPDVLGNSDAGFLVAHGEIETFADGIVRLLVDDTLHAAMSAAALARSVDFAWPKLAEDVVAIYESTIAAAHAP